MVLRPDQLKGRVAKPKFIPKSKRGLAKGPVESFAVPVLVQNSAAEAKVPASSLRGRKGPELPSWRLKLQQELEQTSQNTAKELNWSTKPLDQMTDRDWKLLARDLEITSSSSVRPLRQWSELPSRLFRLVKPLGYKEPTPVQRVSIPIALAGRDLVAIAETGSGKTASFVIPLAVDLEPAASVRALVLAPTRELGQQIYNEALKFLDPLDIHAACLVGGHEIADQAIQLESADLVVATPGRLLDCLAQGLLTLKECSKLVLDEADRMIDMGFEEQVKEIINLLPPTRQTLMFSATWPPKIQSLAAEYLKSPEKVSIGDGTRINSRVTQRAELVEASDRLSRLYALLRKGGTTIVFVNQKATADEVTTALQARGFRAVAMHGAKSQDQREEVLDDLRRGSASILVATDVAGRGIDINDLSLVVNYDMPRTIDAYIHRIGRTGRAGRSGTAVSLVTEKDRPIYGDLREALKAGNCPIPDFLK